MRPSNSIDLDSLTQEIFIEAWQSQTPVTALFIKHRLINAYHTSKAYQSAIERSVSDPPQPSESDSSKSLLNRIMILAELEPLEMQIVVLIFMQSHTYDQVQQKMKWSESKFRTVLSSAMQKLKTAGRIVELEENRGGK